MNLIQVVFVLAGALAAVMIFQAIVFFLFMRETKEINRDLLNRVMAKDYNEYIRGEVALTPGPIAPLPPSDEAIPIYS